MTVDEPSEFELRLPSAKRTGAMTADEWARSQNPHLLVEQLGSRPGYDRKRRLCICACTRRLFPHDTGPVCDWIVTAERYADGIAGGQELQRANALARSSPHGQVGQIGSTLAGRATLTDVSHANFQGAVHFVYRLNCLDESELCDLLRDIFGNPFRPVAFSPEWRTSTAVAIAGGMYEGRDFAAMPILADALQDAGCDHAAVLDHCRRPGTHVRGCWVVDLLLGKS